MRATVLVRAGVPEYDAAHALSERLELPLCRDVDRSLRLRWPAGDTELVVADHRSTDPLLAGYDVALTGEFADEMLARELFGDLRATGWPALLTQADRVVLAWSPERGGRAAGSDHDDPAEWAAYVLPPVTGPAKPARDDELGRLYARIVRNPDSDRPRFDYADAVAREHPDYARLIRAQVRLSRFRREGTHRDRHVGLAGYVSALLRPVQARLLPPAARGLVDMHGVERGFVEHVFVRADAWPAVATDLVRLLPLRALALTDATADLMAAVAAVPELARLRGLGVSGPVGDDGLRALVASPYLSGLRWLDVSGTAVTPAGIEALAAAETVPALKYVQAAVELRLHPEYCYDWDGSLAYTNPATLAEALGKRYDAAWLHYDGHVEEPGYHEV